MHRTRTQWHRCFEVFLEHFEAGTEIAISQTDRTERKKLEIFRCRHPGTAVLGRLHGSIRGDVQSDSRKCIQYGSGAAEELVAEATVGRRDELFLAR